MPQDDRGSCRAGKKWRGQVPHAIEYAIGAPYRNLCRVLDSGHAETRHQFLEQICADRNAPERVLNTNSAGGGSCW